MDEILVRRFAIEATPEFWAKFHLWKRCVCPPIIPAINPASVPKLDTAFRRFSMAVAA